MSNYKNNVLNDNPVSFWTFDYDNQVLVGNEIIDEIGNNNPLFVAGTNYELQALSLNDLEITDQHSIRLAPIEKEGGTWLSSTTLECPHASVYQVEEFTLEMLINKKSANVIRDDGEIAQYQSVHSPIIRKNGLVQVVYTDGYVTQNHITVNVLDHDFVINESTLRPILDETTHLVIRYKIEQIDVNEYKTTASVFLNGYKSATSSETYFDSYPIATGTSSWLIGSNGGSDPISDYQTEELALDQIAFYDYALSDEQVSTHYRKTKRYEELIKKDIPNHYWRFNDLPTISTTVVNEMFSSTQYYGEYYGNYVKYQPTTDKIIDGHSAHIYGNGVCVMGNVNTPQYRTNFISINQDYSVEFWFKTSHFKRGLLLSTMGDIPNWNGLNIFINSYNDFETLGYLQVSESADVKFNSELSNFNDDKWHHLVVKREGNWIRLYVDGDFQGELESAPFSIAQTGLLHVGGNAPNSLNTDLHVSELATYTYALQDIQINNRYHFATRHYIFGHTLLEGAPVQATVRFYNTHTGEKVGEVQSSQGTGEYTFYPYSNRQLDIVALIPDSTTTRYRIHAPITPTEFDDAHLQT